MLRCGEEEEGGLDTNEREVLGEWQLMQGNSMESKCSRDRILNPLLFSRWCLLYISIKSAVCSRWNMGTMAESIGTKLV